jgi:hypothetical protein
MQVQAIARRVGLYTAAQGVVAWRMLVILPMLISACGNPPAEVAARKAARLPVVSGPSVALRAGASVVPDSGQLVLGRTMSIWRSLSAPPHSVHVHEEIAFSQEQRALRRYEFDRTGTLVYFSERYLSERGDSLHDAGYGWIEFAGGNPVMISRVSSTGTRMRYARHELHNIAKRGYMLWDSAVVAAR